MERFCDYCKKPYEPKRKDAMYCSHPCRQMAYVLRKASTVKTGHEFNNGLDLSLNDSYQNTETYDPSFEREDKEASYPSVKSINVINKQQDKPSLRTNSDINAPNIEPAFIDYTSTFITELANLIQKSENVEALADFESNGYTNAGWVSLRYKCIVECLLTFSETSTVVLDDLKEICNAFTAIIRSEAFDSLPDYYPYEKDIIQYRDLLKAVCISSDEDQPVRLIFKKENKIKMLATRWELAQVTPKISFSQLDFEE